jgi:7-cyano-7-deazaguanine synthase
MMKGIVILSGGLDSTTLLYKLVHEGHDVLALSFDYGQRHKKELDAAATVSRMLNVTHNVVKLNDWADILKSSGSSLTNPVIEVPEGHYAEDNMKQTVVPNRNMVMLSIATSTAIASGYDEFVATAVHAGDHEIYPDCRPDFLGSLEHAIRVGNEDFLPDHFKIFAPYIYETKADIASDAEMHGVPIDKTWSCYKGGMFHCGKCGTCVERLEAIDEACVEDDTIYEDYLFWKTVIK